MKKQQKNKTLKQNHQFKPKNIQKINLKNTKTKDLLYNKKWTIKSLTKKHLTAQ
jgi:hypothetical protein